MISYHIPEVFVYIDTNHLSKHVYWKGIHFQIESNVDPSAPTDSWTVDVSTAYLHLSILAITVQLVYMNLVYGFKNLNSDDRDPIYFILSVDLCLRLYIISCLESLYPFVHHEQGALCWLFFTQVGLTFSHLERRTNPKDQVLGGMISVILYLVCWNFLRIWLFFWRSKRSKRIL